MLLPEPLTQFLPEDMHFAICKLVDTKEDFTYPITTNEMIAFVSHFYHHKVVQHIVAFAVRQLALKKKADSLHDKEFFPPFLAYTRLRLLSMNIFMGIHFEDHKRHASRVFRAIHHCLSFKYYKDKIFS